MNQRLNAGAELRKLKGDKKHPVNFVIICWCLYGDKVFKKD